MLPHGASRYDYGCRCVICRTAKSQRTQRYLARPGGRDTVNSYQERRRKQHSRTMNSIKLEEGCLDCGYRDQAQALHFDHRPGVMKCFEISQGYMRTALAVQDELDKCDVLCANCHAIRTHERRA